MSKQAFVAFALEGAISAELLLFTLFLLTNRRNCATLYLMAGLSLDLAAMVAANLLIAAMGLGWLSDPVLFLDLLAPPLFYLYVRTVHSSARPVRATALVHVLPAAGGLALWRSGAVATMDPFVIGCWTAYLIASLAQFVLHHDGYAPRPLRRFIALMMVSLATVTALRIRIAIDAAGGTPYLSVQAYLVVLATVFAVTSFLLFTSLHYPDLLTSPASYIRYGRLGLDRAELSSLEQRFAALFREQAPFLDPTVTLAALSEMLNAPTRQISQLVNSRFGMNVPAYINHCRAQYAALLLRRAPDKPVKVIMFEAGFTSKNVFNREFQRNFGVSPTTYRRKEANRG